MATSVERDSTRSAIQMADNIKDLIDSFHDSTDKSKVLHSVKAFISKCPPPRLREDLANVNLKKFFATISTLDREEMKLCCDVIDSFFVSLRPEEVIQNYSTELGQGIATDNVPVQLICLAELRRVPVELYESFLLKEGTVISSLIHLITCEPLALALSASSTLARIGECKGRTSRLFDKHLEEIKEAISKSDVVRFRFYELFINIAAVDEASLNAVDDTGLLSELIDELFEEKSPDILAQMNCIELLNNLATTNHGFTWMEKHRIMDKMEVLTSKINSESILSLLLPGLLVFFGGLAKTRPQEICDKYKLFRDSLFQSISSSDMTLKGIALETIAHIGSTVNGKLILSQYPEMDVAVKEFGSTLRGSSTETKSRTLCALANLLALKPKDHTPELLSLTKKWFNNLVDDPFKLIFSFCTQPFQSVRLGGHKVLLSLACQPWGQDLMKDHPTFQEYLLNRSIEAQYEWRFSKFKIVEAMVECDFTKETFGSEYYLKLVQHHKLGPNYVEAESAVALEEAS